MSEGHKAQTPRARTFADPAVDALLECTGELSRRWAIALVLERPLEGLGEVPLAQLAAEAPALCGALLRALTSEHELTLLLGDDGEPSRRGAGLARRVAALAGARDAGTVIAAVESLRGVLWEAMLAELSPATDSHARRLADASDRLAYVCSALLPAALGALETGEDNEPADSSRQVPEAHIAASGARGGSAPSPSREIVIVDERGDGERQDGPRVAPPAPIGAPELSGTHEIEVRDERGGEGPGAWIRSIGHQLERFEVDHLPFAVLLVEVSYEQASPGSPDGIEQALQSTLREAGGGSLTRERGGRYWLLATRTDRSGASDLADRLRASAMSVAAADGNTIEVAVGTAVCPQDGMQPSALAAHADIGLYAARSRSSAGGLAGAPGEDR